MRKAVIILLLLVLSATWLYFISAKYNGLNSVLGLAGYKDGLPGVRGLPRDSLIRISDPFGQASVLLDTLGIAHIYGKDERSAAFAAGFVHARDRYFQMELLAYSAMGRLSEMIGEQGLGSDRQWKIFDLEDKAKDYLDTLQRVRPELYDYLTAYTAGINAYLSTEERRRRDPMYTIWDYSPRPWKAYYTFLIQWYMSYNLTFNDDYVDMQEILDKVPDTLRKILYPGEPDSRLFIIPSSPAKTTPSSPEHSLVSAFSGNRPNNYPTMPHNRSLGSNNWVVGSGHTASKELFLCNDLHLFLASPNIFYEMQLCGPGFHVYGYTIPGVPLILTGHNEKIAWGITSGEWDVTEQYLLVINPKNKDQYKLDGKWKDMTVREFTLNVKGQEPQKYSVKYTVFGPLVQKDQLSYGLMWHPQRSATAIEAFWKLMKASDWNDFREALRQYDYPSQNFVYGDILGNIGMVCAGRMPVKPRGYAGGMLDGTTSPQWNYIPFDSLPQSYDPARNFLFSANQQPAAGNYYAARWFEDLYRPERIRELLDNGKMLRQADMREMQLDITDISVRDLKVLLVKYTPQVVVAGDWASMVDWDGRLVPGTKEANLYKFFRDATWEMSGLLAGKLGVKKAPGFDQFIHFLKNYDSVRIGKETQYCKQIFARIINKADSVYQTYMAGKDAMGFDPPYSFDIPSMTFLPGLSVKVRDIGGSDNTVDVNYGAHPVIRTLIGISNGKIESWMVNAIGQTGRLDEKDYYQQLSSWKENQLHKTQFVNDPVQLQAIRSRIIFSQH